MRKLVSIFFIGALLSVNVLSAQNQQRKKGNQQQQAKMEEMNAKAKTELNLSDDQSKKWDDIQEEYGDDFAKVRENDSMSNEEKQSQMRQLRTSKQDAIAAILTKEQYEEYKQMQKEMRGQNKNGNSKGRSGGGNGLSQMKSELNLSEKQSIQWDEIVNNNRNQMQVLRSNQTLDDADKNQKMKDQRGNMEAELMAILNSEQQAEFKQSIEEQKQMRKKKGNGNGNGNGKN